MGSNFQPSLLPHKTEKIIITGFEPFGSFATNPSLTACSALNGTTVSSLDPTTGRHRTARIEAVEFPVVYSKVTELVPQLHNTSREDKPLAILHIGASPQKPHHFLRLETRSHGTCYVKKDNAGLTPVDGICQMPGLEEPLACLPLNNSYPARLVSRLPRGKPWLFSLSPDAGHYLCDFTLFVSTVCAENSGIPVLFLHVPPVGMGYPLSESELVEGIRFLLQGILEVCVEDQVEREERIELSGNVGLKGISLASFGSGVSVGSVV
jgi:pyrrolidone-carboxylate peptidase